MPFGILKCVSRRGVLFCPGNVNTRVASFDGVPLDVNVTLPMPPKSPLPLVVLSHGFGGSKVDLSGSQPWAKAGYGVLAITARGFGDSCGSVTSRRASGCANAYVRIDDARYEARDIQYLAGLLADEGIVDPQRIGVTGGSYGGVVSFEAAVLKDRIMNTDGSLSPWTSPHGTPMRIAGAAAIVPGSDVGYGLMPNGRTLDYTSIRPRRSR